MAKRQKPTEPETEQPNAQSELAAALIQAINITKPITKKNIFTRTANTPWTPKDGGPRLKFKRRTYHHGVELRGKVSNAEIALCNQLRPGVYGDGFFKVIRRRDKGLDIDYPIKTASQRLKLINQFGIRSFEELLQFLVAEAARPKKDEFAPTVDEE